MIPNSQAENHRKSHQLRQDLRIQASFLVDVILNHGRAVFGKLEDLSLNGAKLRLPVSLTPGSPLTVDLANYQLTLKATCRWSMPYDWNVGSYLTGISFNQINSELYARLRQILFSLAG